MIIAEIGRILLAEMHAILRVQKLHRKLCRCSGTEIWEKSIKMIDLLIYLHSWMLPELLISELQGEAMLRCMKQEF